MRTASSTAPTSCAWQRGLGIPGGATRSDGDANVDGRVDRLDLDVWKSAFANPAQSSAATAPASR